MRFPNQTRPLVISDILRRVQEVVSARMYTITKEMVDLDYANINTISKMDFKTICDRHFMRLTDDQVISSTLLKIKLPRGAFHSSAIEEPVWVLQRTLNLLKM